MVSSLSKLENNIEVTVFYFFLFFLKITSGKAETS